LPALSDTTIYALSDQVAAPLRPLSRNPIRIAAEPSEDALLDLIAG
jgi:hypothetical protein